MYYDEMEMENHQNRTIQCWVKLNHVDPIPVSPGQTPFPVSMLH